MLTSATISTPLSRRLAAVLAAGALLGPAASGAAAQGCQGQAGTSALEQYCEAIPRGDGGRDSPTKSGSDTESGVSASTRKALAAAGTDGFKVAALASAGVSASAGTTPKATTPKTGSSASKSSDAGATTPAVAGPDDASGSPLQAATDAVSNGSTAGPALVWGLVGMSAAGAAGAILLRRRVSGEHPLGDDPTDTPS